MGALALTLPLTVWALKHSGNTSPGEKHLQASSEQNVVAIVPSGWRQAGLVICLFFSPNGQIEKSKTVLSDQGLYSKCLYKLHICEKYYLNIGCSYLDFWFGNRLQVLNEDPHLPSAAQPCHMVTDIQVLIWLNKWLKCFKHQNPKLTLGEN